MKSNTKKRLIAFMLCMVLVLSSATSAFADEQQDMDSTNQIETTAEAETETQEAVADEPMVTSLDASSEEQQPVADEPAVTAEEPAADEEEIDETDDLALVAVITAALAASLETSPDKLIVRSIRRKNTNRW